MMPLTDEGYDLPALSRDARVTPRTIRYYVQQGLLPSPGGRGPGTRYDRGHLDRLRLIKRLQKRHLPLAEIRRRLEEMDDASVSDALRAASGADEGSTALEYVQQVLARGVAPQRPGPVARLSKSGSPQASQFVAVAAGSAPLAAPSGSEVVAREQRSQWERITLAPDVEMHVRRPLSRAQNRMVERLIEVARRALEEGEP
jgi:DNA-binding transcriptional MerR regulator